jgi:hypothetical protein
MCHNANVQQKNMMKRKYNNMPKLDEYVNARIFTKKLADFGLTAEKRLE